MTVDDDICHKYSIKKRQSKWNEDNSAMLYLLINQTHT